MKLPRFLLLWAAFFFLGSVLVYDTVKVTELVVPPAQKQNSGSGTNQFSFVPLRSSTETNNSTKYTTATVGSGTHIDSANLESAYHTALQREAFAIGRMVMAECIEAKSSGVADDPHCSKDFSNFPKWQAELDKPLK